MGPSSNLKMQFGGSKRLRNATERKLDSQLPEARNWNMVAGGLAHLWPDAQQIAAAQARNAAAEISIPSTPFQEADAGEEVGMSVHPGASGGGRVGGKIVTGWDG